MTHHIMPVRTYRQIFAALLLLLFATLGGAYLPLGDFHFAVAMAFATAKAVLIILFFMHVMYSSRLTKMIVSTSFLFLGILVIMFLNDYLSRG